MAQGSPLFETTLWSEVLLAGRERDTSEGRQALERLCKVYWYPIYAFIRRRSVRPEDAQDLTQGFFEHVLSSNFLERADPDRGRFRNFLLGAVRNYMRNEWDKTISQRRGGWAERVSFDAAMGEHWLSVEPTSTNDSTRAFDRSWSLALINHALTLLEEEQAAAGKSTAFALLKQFLQRTATVGEYDEVSKKLAMTKGAVAAAVHRLSERYGALVRKLVRDTVVNADMAEEELRFLYSALRE